MLSANPKHSQARPPEGWKGFYPAVPDVVIEQELTALTAWMEMGKLVRTRAKLKVLITFTRTLLLLIFTVCPLDQAGFEERIDS